MNNYLYIAIYFILFSFSIHSNASNLSDDAKKRGINETCYSYLAQIEESYGLNGLNVTFAHPDEVSTLPSLHVSVQRYNNGASSFSATLTPQGEFCFLSVTQVTFINNQSCKEIALIKTVNESFQASSYADGSFTILTPPDNTYQIILTSTSDTSCSMSEARMLWPGT
jgi:hypothetical protein